MSVCVAKTNAMRCSPARGIGTLLQGLGANSYGPSQMSSPATEAPKVPPEGPGPEPGSPIRAQAGIIWAYR